MSIKDQIGTHLGNALFYLPSRFQDSETPREMVVSRDIFETVTPPFGPYWEGKRHAEFRAYLDAFVDDEEIGVSEKPFTKRADTYLARVHPIELDVWDIRIIEPAAGIRCFGCFGDRNLFVALTWDYRENLDETADGFAALARDCRAVWSSLFTIPPRTGSIDVHLSSNYYLASQR
jgi:hypothetical protein